MRGFSHPECSLAVIGTLASASKNHLRFQVLISTVLATRLHWRVRCKLRLLGPVRFQKVSFVRVEAAEADLAGPDFGKKVFITSSATLYPH
jgi:hypothetical protein